MKRFILLSLVLILAFPTLGFAPVVDSHLTGTVYVVHGVPGLTVDVYVNGGLTLADFEPRTIAGPLSLPAGDYDIVIVPAGGDYPDDAVIIGSAMLAAGANVSIVAHLAEDGTPILSVFANDLSPVEPGKGRLALRHTAAAPAVDAELYRRWGLVATFENLANGQEASADLRAGLYFARLQAAAGDTLDIADDETDHHPMGFPLVVRPRYLQVLYVIGSLEDGTLSLLRQKIRIPKPPKPPGATVYVVHGVPGLTVDVYVNGALTLPGFEPKTIAGPLTLPAGDYELDILPAGGVYPDDAVISGSATLGIDDNVAIVAHLDEGGGPTLSIFENDFSKPGRKDGRLIVRHTAAAPAVDATVTNLRRMSYTLEDLENGEQAQADIPMGIYRAKVTLAGESDSVIGPVWLPVRSRRVYVLYAIGSAADGSLDLIRQVISFYSW